MFNVHAHENHAPKFCDPEARPWILGAAILVSALGFIDGTVVSIAIPAIRETLDASLVEAQWISNAYMLPLSALILLGGAAGDRYGIARTLQLGLALFMGASILSALAPSPEVLIAGRAIKGIGAALMVPGSLALIARAYPADIRGKAIGTWAAASAVTTAIGPVIGGALLSFGSPEIWRLIFAINLPLGAFVFWILLRRVGQDPRMDNGPLDWVGAALATVALGSGAFLLSIAGASSAPTPFTMFLLSLVAIGCGLLFLYWETRASNPLMPLDLFRNRVFSSANLLTFFLYFALSAVLFYLPMTLISAWGVSEITTTAAFIPMSVFIGLLSRWVGGLADTHGARPLITVGSIIVGAAFIGLGVTADQRDFWAWVVPLCALMGFGMSLVVGPLSTAVMGSVSNARTGAASGVNNAVSRVSGLVAVAAMGGLAAIVYGNAGGPESFAASSDLDAHQYAMDVAFASIAYVTGALALLSAVVAWFGLRDLTSGDRGPGGKDATSHDRG